MSRIVLSRFPDGEPQVVVGYDRPFESYFAQEYAPVVDDQARDELLVREVDGCATVKALQQGMKAAGFTRHVPPSAVSLLLEHRTVPYPQTNVVVDLSRAAQPRFRGAA